MLFVHLLRTSMKQTSQANARMEMSRERGYQFLSNILTKFEKEITTKLLQYIKESLQESFGGG